MEVGDVYKRTGLFRTVPTYYVVVVSVDERNVCIRREMIEYPLIHEDVIWQIKEFLQYFEKT